MVKKDIEHIENLENLFQQAVTLHHNNEIYRACKLYKEVLRVMPDSPLVNYNLGLAFFELQEYAESYACYLRALQQAPHEHDLLYNFALCAKQLGKHEEAVDVYGTILEQNPEDIDSLYNLGCCLIDLGADPEAIKMFSKVLDISDNHTSALNNLACVYHRNGDYDHAQKYYTRLLKIEPEHPIAQHLLASVQGDTTQTAPDQYIEQIFDNYSSRYEKNMLKDLQYNVPLTMKHYFDQCVKTQPKSLKTLDLGCGTGLCGEAFLEICSSLVGVDLSSNMIEQASSKDLYSSLHIEEIIRFINSCEEQFDLILAADVLNYFGDLQVFFGQLQQISQPGTYLCFSTEKSSDRNFVLRRSGRFAHKNEYLNEICTQNGWKIIKAEPTNLRKERFSWIEGMIYIATRINSKKVSEKSTALSNPANK